MKRTRPTPRAEDGRGLLGGRSFLPWMRAIRRSIHRYPEGWPGTPLYPRDDHKEPGWNISRTASKSSIRRARMARRSEERRNVTIMTTCMHRTFGSRRVVDAASFVELERIHVRSEDGHRPVDLVDDHGRDG